MTLDTHRLQTLDQVREFLDGSREIDLRPQTRADAYAFVVKTVQRFEYALRAKADKGLLHRFLAKATGLSRAQITGLLHRDRTTGEITDRRGAPRQPFPRRYIHTDIGLLADLDALHGTLSGPATRKLGARAWHLFGDCRFQRLAAISNGHLYNLRHSTTYQRRRGTVPLPTRPVHIAIGERRRPQPLGQPGYIRVDTVHQGDLDGIKGLYHLNLVDEVTQFQFIGSVEHIHASCLAPVLEALLRAFPFTLHYLNFHRPCFFPSEEMDAKGRGRKRYRDADIMPPYEKLKSLPNAAACLQPRTTFAQLDAVASALSDNEAAHALNQARDRLFGSIDPAA